MKHVLVIGATWPEPASTAAGCRMMQLLDYFQRSKYKISFASAAVATEHSVAFDSAAVSSYSIELNKSSFDDVLLSLNPDMVLFDRFMTEEQYGWRVAKNCPNAVRLLDTEDLHCLRLGRQQAFKEGKEFSFSYLNSPVAKREIASILRCDLSLMISEVEIDLLRNHFKIDKAILHYLPFLLDGEVNQDVPDFESRKDFISIGNFLHEPNWDSVQYLKSTIWPLIRKQIPDAKINVYGAYPGDKAQQLHNTKEGFIIKGRADNVHNVMTKARICLAPLRFGAGLKGKLLDAMVNGTPSVTTSIGAEGMDLNGEWNGVITNDEQHFATAAVELYTSLDKWKTAKQKGYEILKTRFDAEMQLPVFTAKLQYLFTELAQHREQNFMGSLLMQDIMNSAKYMSLWIEEKNKKS